MFITFAVLYGFRFSELLSACPATSEFNAIAFTRLRLDDERREVVK